MKLYQITINNVLGIKSASIAINAPVLLLAGHNHAGKSSIAEAVRQALTGEVARVNMKKEYGQLVHGAEKSGSVLVEHDQGTSTLALPSGTIEGQINHPALAFCLSPELFARLDEKERRQFMFKLMGVKVTPAEVKKRLLAAKHAPVDVELIEPLLGAGFDAAAKEAANQGTQEKGAWRQLTGENYGSEKAVTWQAAVPDNAPTLEALQGEKNKLAKIENDLANLTRELARMEGQVKQAEETSRRLKTLRETAERLPKLQSKLQIEEKEQARLQALFDDLHEGGLQAATKPLSCPHCHGAVIVSANGLEAYSAPENQPKPADPAKRKEIHDALQLMIRATANTKRDLQASQDAATTLKGIDAAGIDKVPTANDLETRRLELHKLTTARKDQRDIFESMTRLFDQASQAEEKTFKALALHKAVSRWKRLADDLAPGGIPSAFLAEAIEPFNQILAEFADCAGWAAPEVAQDDMALTYGGRPYRLCSESEKWRCDALVALAIAAATKLGVVILDRFDVLDIESRGQLVYLLGDLAQTGDINTAIVIGTMKSQPSSTEAVQSVWVDAGRALVKSEGGV